MTKKRILLCGEHSELNSGYANWSRNLLNGLYKTNKYELAELACFCTADKVKHKKQKWKVYANSVGPTDERYQLYKSNTNNTYGQWRFDAVCLDFRPDVVIDFRDPWMFEFQSYSVLRKYFKWLIMPPIDSYPQKNEWITIFSNADMVIPYTNWAKNILSKYKHIRTYDIISPAGVDYDQFIPMSLDKTKYGLPKDKFILGSVMRNQKRKLIPSLFELISKLPEDNILYLHTTYPEIMGWNIPKLLLDYNIYNRVYFTYKCSACDRFFASTFKGPLIQCKDCSYISCGLANTQNGITDAELAEIYNLFDIYIQYAICEGFGMPQIEASSCGLPVLSVDYSAMSEVVRTIDGYPIPLKNLQYEIESGALRAYPDIEETIFIINQYKNLSPKQKFEKQKNTRQLTIDNYSWNNTIKSWESAIDLLTESSESLWRNKDTYELPDNVKLNYSLDNYTFVKNICEDILKEPNLMKTQMIQHMLYSLDHGSSAKGQFTKKDVASHLEKFSHHKARSEHIRTTPGQINDDYITIANEMSHSNDKE